MVPKTLQKELAITLRKQGLSYREIMTRVPVAKSTVSLWLQSVSLAKHQRHALTQKRIDAALRGAAAKRQQRIERTGIIVAQSRKEIGPLSRRERWLIGSVLYWAEGSKQRASTVSNSVTFNNSDPAMVRFFKDWLIKIVGVGLHRLKFELYIHESQEHRLMEIQRYWAKELTIPAKLLGTVYFKRNAIKRIRTSSENGYYGLVRIRVRASSELNRTIAGWIEGIVK